METMTNSNLMIISVLFFVTMFFTIQTIDAQIRPPPPTPIDSDKDGISDLNDKCPVEPETFNGFEDTDGCPDEAPPQPTDNDGDSIDDLFDKCINESENFNGFEDTDGCPDDPRGPTKVIVFSQQQGNSILVEWKTDISTVENIKYNYKVLRSVDLGRYNEIFNSERNINEKIINEKDEESFFYLDNNVGSPHNYTYQVITENPNDLSTVVSNPSNIIIIKDQIIRNTATAKAFLIQGRNISPAEIQDKISNTTWFEWVFKQQFANAETFVENTFTTGSNPKDESYRLALTPLPTPNSTNNCDQTLSMQYSKNINNGQKFTMVATIYEMATYVDDNGPNGTNIETNVELLRHQKTFTFDKFIINNTINQKWFVIHPEDKTIINFTNLEIQLDIDSEDIIDPTQYRNLSFWNIFFEIPLGNNSC